MAAIRTIKIGRLDAAKSSQLLDNGTTMEVDNHADTTVLGKDALIVHDWDRPVNVSGYDPKTGSTECPTITGAVAYDDPFTGQTYIFVYHQAISVKSLRVHLMCPMQHRVNGVRISETPKFLADAPTSKTHAIEVDDPLDPSEPLIIPLQIKGVTSYFSVRKPTVDEYEDEDLPHITMTAEGPEWEPCSSDFAEQEAAMTDFRGQIVDRETIARGRRIISAVSHTCIDVEAIDFTDDDNFGQALQSKVTVSRVGVGKNKRSITAETLARKWLVSPEAAKRTVQQTTQRGVRTVLHPSLSR